MALNDVIEVCFYTRQGSQTAVNVWHYNIIGQSATPPAYTDYANHFGTLIGPLYRAILANTSSYYGTSARKVWPLPISVLGTSILGQGVGSLADPPMGKQLAGMITKRTLTAGPKGRGRMFVAFPAEGSNTGDGVPTAAYISSILTIGSNLATDQAVSSAIPGDSANLRPVIWRRNTGTMHNITSVVARGRWGTMQKRGDYGKSNLPPF